MIQRKMTLPLKGLFMKITIEIVLLIIMRIVNSLFLDTGITQKKGWPQSTKRCFSMTFLKWWYKGQSLSYLVIMKSLSFAQFLSRSFVFEISIIFIYIFLKYIKSLHTMHIIYFCLSLDSLESVQLDDFHCDELIIAKSIGHSNWIN